jgi:peptidoglycan/LPS O-acetylase OafA/YrhL
MMRGVYYPHLDYLRAGASLGVLASHSDPWHLLPSEFGNASVQVFFALSGFLIGGILLRSKWADLPRFYFNRATRIWIPYFLAVAFLIAATVLKQPLSDPKLWEILFYKVTFVYNIFGTPQLADFVARFPLAGTGNHFWSICVEEQFYLVSPFIIVLAPRAAVLIAAALVAINFLHPHDFAAISLGVLLASSRQIFGDWFARIGPRLALAFLFSLIISILAIQRGLYSFIFPFAAVSLVAIFASTGQQQELGRIAGGMSFSLYLDAWIAFFAVNYLAKMLHMVSASILVGIVGALLLSFIHYQLVDRRIAQNRENWFNQRTGVYLCMAGFALLFVGFPMGLFGRLL